MDPLAAARGICESKPLSIAAVAGMMGMSPRVLANKLNPHNDTHHLRLDEAVQMSVATNNPAILFAFAERLGFLCMPALFGPGCTTSPIVALSGLMAAHGDVGEAIGLAVADGRIDCAELMDIEDALLSQMAKIHQLAQAVRAAHKRGMVVA